MRCSMKRSPSARDCDKPFGSARCQHRRHISVELAVAVEDQILGCTLLREGLSQLLHDPGTGGMFGDVEVQDVATAVRDHEEAVQYPKGRGGHGEKVHGGDSLTMVLEKGE